MRYATRRVCRLPSPSATPSRPASRERAPPPTRRGDPRGHWSSALGKRRPVQPSGTASSNGRRKADDGREEKPHPACEGCGGAPTSSATDRSRRATPRIADAAGRCHPRHSTADTIRSAALPVRSLGFSKNCVALPGRGDYEGIGTSGAFGGAGHMGDQHLHAVLQHVRKLAAAPAANPPSDRDLLDRFVAHRDEAAFAALVERHGAMVLGICRRVLRHAHDAEDAWQAAFLVLARKAATIRRKDALGAWLHGVAYH